MKRVLLLFLFFFIGCGTSAIRLGPYSIGRDPSWFPLRLGVITTNINGFTNALVQKLAKLEKKKFQIVDVAWNQLFVGLEKRDYAGIFTSLTPTGITKERYSFSEPFFLLGPVLVVPEHSTAHSLADLDGAFVGVYQFDESILIAQKHPEILIVPYQNAVAALENVVHGTWGGALLPNLEARGMVAHLYAGQVKIVTQPLSNKGLRLITLKGENQALIKDFNEGIQKLQKEGTVQELRQQFGIK